jgi:hypothetical protein
MKVFQHRQPYQENQLGDARWSGFPRELFGLGDERAKIGPMLKNFHPSGEPIWPHPLRCGPFAVLGVQLHGPTPCGCGHLGS